MEDIKDCPICKKHSGIDYDRGQDDDGFNYDEIQCSNCKLHVRLYGEKRKELIIGLWNKMNLTDGYGYIGLGPA